MDSVPDKFRKKLLPRKNTGTLLDNIPQKMDCLILHYQRQRVPSHFEQTKIMIQSAPEAQQCDCRGLFSTLFPKCSLPSWRSITQAKDSQMLFEVLPRRVVPTIKTSCS